MDSLEKLVAAAQEEFDNAYTHFAKLGESMGRLESIIGNVRKRVSEFNKVAEGGRPSAQKPPKGTNDLGRPKSVVQTVSVGVCGCPVGEPGAKGPDVGLDRVKLWHEVLKPPAIVKTIVEKSSYVIPPKCIKYKFFEDKDGDFFIEFRVTAEHHHSATTYVAVEEFSIPLLDCLDEQIEVFDRHIGNLMTVKFQPKGYSDDERDWSNL